MSQSFPMFSCKYHIVLGFTFRYLIHSDLIFAYGASTLTSSGCSQHIPEATQSHLRKRFPYFSLLAFSFTYVFPLLPKHLPLSHEKVHKKIRKPMQKFIFYLNSKNLKLLSNSGKYHNAGPQGEASYTETDKLSVYTADKPRRCVDYIFTALDVF